MNRDDFTATPIQDVIDWMNKAEHLPSPANAELYRSLIQEEFKELVQAEVDNEGEAAELKELLDLVWVCFGYARARGWPVPEAWNELSWSNYSKFTVVNGVLTLKKREDGKVLKPPSYQPANMTDVISNN